MEDKKCLIIFDSNAVIHRAFHALPPLTTKEGKLVNAVYGFLLVFLKVIKEFQPDFIAACFDLPAPTFRHKQFAGYKAKRPSASPDLYQQIPLVKEILRVFKVPIFEQEGFEADDLIGTIAHLSPVETIIVSGDTDTLQLIDSKTKVYVLRKGVKDILLYDENLVKEKYQGLTPNQLLDFRALKGDPSDNIPGVAGIGEKTAIELLGEFRSLENIYENLALIKTKTRELLMKNKETAFLSKDLSKIQKDAPISFNLEQCRWGSYDKEEAKKILERFEFHSLISRLP